MVFGNMGEDSGTGVAFTRNPNTGAKELYGEYLTNAQGEDVVAGIRTPAPISQMKGDLPKAYAEFEKIAKRLEKHYRDAQDLEFTIERGKLYMLQTRSAKRTAAAAVKIATDMVREGLITKDEALQRVEPAQVEQLLLPRVAGCAALEIDLGKREMRVDGRLVHEGEAISIDGTTGEVFAGELPTIQPNFREEKALIELLSWADKRRRLGVWVNADTPGECKLARELGAEGVGLARTEHMFRQAERLPIVQDMIMADSTEGRERALAKLLPFQQGDFREMFEAMDGLPVVIRLIDPPLHEFLREYADVDIEIAVARATGKDGADLAEKERIYRRLEQLHEDNPMLGLPGCRLLLVNPEILAMQIPPILA